MKGIPKHNYDFTDARVTANLFYTLYDIVTNNTWVIVGVCHFKP